MKKINALFRATLLALLVLAGGQSANDSKVDGTKYSLEGFVDTSSDEE